MFRKNGLEFSIKKVLQPRYKSLGVPRIFVVNVGVLVKDFNSRVCCDIVEGDGVRV